MAIGPTGKNGQIVQRHVTEESGFNVVFVQIQLHSTAVTCVLEALLILKPATFRDVMVS